MTTSWSRQLLRGSIALVLAIVAAPQPDAAARARVLEVGRDGAVTVLAGDVNWGANSTVRVRGTVRVAPGATLRIGPAARVEAAAGTELVVDRSARVEMIGSLVEPIVFTCSGPVTPGCWDGVTVLGNAPINHGTPTSPPARGAGTAECLEAVSPGGGLYGGCAADDSSGAMRFVRVEHALRGLRLFGVGRTTVIDNVQVHRSLGSGLEIVGGTVDISRVALTANAQFGLDWRGGWQGRAQFVLIQQSPDGFAGGIRGANGVRAVDGDALPRSAPTISQVTIIAGSFATNPYQATPPRAVILERGTAGRLANFYVAKAPVLLDVDDPATCLQLSSGALSLAGIVAAGVAGAGDPDADPVECASIAPSPSTEEGYLLRPATTLSLLTSPGVADTLLLSADDLLLPDLRPRASAPVFTIGAVQTPSDAFFEPVSLVGAVDVASLSRGNVPWYSGWTLGGALPPPPPGTVTGLVTSPLLGAVRDARVVLSPSGFSTLTGTDGRFTIPNVPAGPLTVRVSVVPTGCAPPVDTDAVLIGGATLTVDPVLNCVPAPSVALDAGAQHTCGLDELGTGYCWGANARGQLGIGSTLPSAVPVAVAAGAIRFQAISAGNNTTCGLDASRVLYCWGSNQQGQLGINDSSVTQVDVPTAVATSLRFLSVSVGAEHVCALAESGAAYCWGSGSDGKLGDNAGIRRYAPSLVQGGFLWRSVSAGASLSCGVATTGVAYCWGAGVTGGLGNPALTQAFQPQAAFPVLTPSADALAAIFTGASQACAVAVSGTAYCWGTNVVGQTGTGTVNQVSTPTLVVGGQSWVSIGMAAEGSFVNHVCGTSTAGGVSCWGLGDRGQLGVSPPQSCFFIVPYGCATLPQPVPIPSAIRAVAGLSHSCALLVSGDVWCWGSNDAGQLGDGTALSRTAPAAVVGGVNWPNPPSP